MVVTKRLSFAMKPQLCKLVYLATVFSSLILVSPATAQLSSVGIERREQLLSALRPACERMVFQITTHREITLALSARPIQTSDVCNCSEAKISSDPRLEKFWPLSERDMKGSIESEQVKSYITGRMITSVLQCLSQEFDTSLGKAPLP